MPPTTSFHVLLPILIFPIIPHLDAAAASRPCSNGYSHGSDVTQGRYWYECRDGQLIPKGCLSLDSRRLNLGETYDDQSVRIQCTMDKDGYLSFSYKCCVNSGQEYHVDQEWRVGNLFYTCNIDGASFRAQVSGCADSDGVKIPLNQESTKADFVYECRKLADGTYRLVPTGCSNDGRNYRVGDKFEKGNSLYVCDRKMNGNDEVITTKCIGCVHEGHELGDGDQIVQSDIVYGCKVSAGKTKMKAVACATNENGVDVHKRVNCTWVEGTGEYRYEVICKMIENTDRATKLYTRCVYEVRGGAYVIDPGCYKIDGGSTAAGCVRNPDGKLEIRVFQKDQITQAVASGLRFC